MKSTSKEKIKNLEKRRNAPLATPSDLGENAGRDIGGALNAVLADIFALYLKTKNFHWHMSGPNFRSYHLLLDEQATELFAMTDPIAERIRKLGCPTIKSIGQISRLQRVLDNDAQYVTPSDMLAELRDDSKSLTTHLRQTHALCSEYADVGSSSLIELWIDQSERRTWILFESTRRVDAQGD